MRALALAAVATLALGGITTQPASASSAKAAALSCPIRITDPATVGGSYVYSLVEVNCNQRVSYIGGYLSLYRDGVYLGYAETYLYNTAYAYKINMVACVPGNYHVMGYGFANLDGGAPDFSLRVASTPAYISCT
ncbi:hypothetical protein [Sphaerisporangium aureirubrum]|uniref:Spore-associated protein A n=1 Tax=Sphaerisporangium aureirubrum TaxID=1544736 RepID=A0ABW1NC71_9ACTN